PQGPDERRARLGHLRPAHLYPHAGQSAGRRGGAALGRALAAGGRPAGGGARGAPRRPPRPRGPPGAGGAGPPARRAAGRGGARPGGGGPAAAAGAPPPGGGRGAPGARAAPGGPAAPGAPAAPAAPGAPGTPPPLAAVPSAALPAPVRSAIRDVHFEFDRYDLTEETKRTLEDLAQALKANPGFGVLIDGHADERGTSEYNLALGQRRAQAAEDHLTPPRGAAGPPDPLPDCGGRPPAPPPHPLALGAHPA